MTCPSCGQPVPFGTPESRLRELVFTRARLPHHQLSMHAAATWGDLEELLRYVDVLRGELRRERCVVEILREEIDYKAKGPTP